MPDPQRAQRVSHLPGEEGVWVFIFGDLIVFSVFFLTYVFYRAADLPLYLASQQLLSRPLGLANTLLLLTSSWFAAQAVKQTRNGGTHARAFLLAAMGCGLGFCLIKIVEYGSKLAAGISLNTNEFFTFYFMFTGIHLVHVLIGLAVLGFLAAHANRPCDASHIRVVEGGAAFWHLVDMLWVVLFALLYLMR
jgi:nitric oxide reductase NorE protein